MAYYLVRPDELEWDEYTNYPGRHRAALTESAALRHTRANLIRHEAGTAQQMANATDEELLVFVYGAPPERTGADVIDSAV